MTMWMRIFAQFTLCTPTGYISRSGRSKKEGLACHVGVSVYDTDEAIACIKSPFVDYIQAPYSVFDHRMKEKNVFKMSQQNGCTTDTRTAFVKGLIRLSVDEVPDYLADAKPILDKLDQICKRRVILGLNWH